MSYSYSDTTTITIKDVAKESGLSLASVHRALNDKPGVSENTRTRVKRIAEELGYNPNFFASNMKKKQIRIAAIIVSPNYAGRFYFNDIWRGIREFVNENAAYDIEFIPLPFTDEIGPNIQLQNLWDNYRYDIDGIVITPTNSISTIYNEHETNFYLSRYAEIGIPVVFIGNDVCGIDRLCCVCPNAESTNNLAAEYICSLIPNESKVIIASRKKDVPSQACNIQRFENSLKQMNKSLELLKIYQEDVSDSKYSEAQQSIYKEVTRLITENSDIKLVYSCNARFSIPMAQAVKDLGKTEKIKMVGNDLFEENISFLNERVITSLIFKNPKEQGYSGMKVLFNKIVKNENPSSIIHVATNLIFKSNLEFYL